MLALTYFALLGAVAAAPYCTPSTSYYNVKNARGNFCIDNKDAQRVDHNPVQVWECNPTNRNQQWIFTPGKYPTQIKLAGTDFCLSGGDAPADGTRLTIEKCSSDYKMTWSGPTTDKICLLGTNLCIDLTDGHAANGTPLQLWTWDQCGSNPNQQWSWSFSCF